MDTQWIHSGYAPFIYPQNSFPYTLIDSSTIYYCIHNYIYIYINYLIGRYPWWSTVASFRGSLLIEILSIYIYLSIYLYIYIYQYIINTDSPGTSSFSRRVGGGPGAQLPSVVRWAISQERELEVSINGYPKMVGL